MRFIGKTLSNNTCAYGSKPKHAIFALDHGLFKVDGLPNNLYIVVSGLKQFSH